MNKENTDMNERGASAAERLGRALLESLGAAPGSNEDEIVDAILGEWKHAKEKSGKAPDERRPSDGKQAVGDPFAGVMRPPVPMRANAVPGAPVDYADMSQKQFNELKKLLRKAASDGRKIKL